MKKIIKLLSLVIVFVLAFSALASCGSSEEAEQSKAPDTTANAVPNETEPAGVPETDDSGSDGVITGENREWGDYTVFVPGEFELVEGGEFSSYDFSVKKSDFYYFDFNVKADDDNMMQHYNYNKNTYTNEQTDFEVTYGSAAWTGFQYSDGWGGYGFEAYTTMNGKIVRVSSAGYTFNSPEAAAVLGSFAAK